ncbi:hypothetical protein GGX14DRAFT_399979 [Mycena pura]|uniref:Uncharacterized protein n=1 Tax=Mycena pura TaxID=153505 RepID=A0AAD6V404_9AGAR|nr:hypothetical protein GGX14DRAFT_399979 [Mycena pura]
MAQISGVEILRRLETYPSLAKLMLPLSTFLGMLLGSGMITREAMSEAACSPDLRPQHRSIWEMDTLGEQSDRRTPDLPDGAASFMSEEHWSCGCERDGGGVNTRDWRRWRKRRCVEAAACTQAVGGGGVHGGAWMRRRGRRWVEPGALTQVRGGGGMDAGAWGRRRGRRRMEAAAWTQVRGRGGRERRGVEAGAWKWRRGGGCVDVGAWTQVCGGGGVNAAAWTDSHPCAKACSKVAAGGSVRQWTRDGASGEGRLTGSRTGHCSKS